MLPESLFSLKINPNLFTLSSSPPPVGLHSTSHSLWSTTHNSFSPLYFSVPFPWHFFQQLSPHAAPQQEQATLNHPLNFSCTTPSIISRANPQLPQESKPIERNPLKLQPWLECREMGTKLVPFFRGNKSNNLLADCAGPVPAITSAKHGTLNPCSLLPPQLHPHTNQLHWMAKISQRKIIFMSEI